MNSGAARAFARAAVCAAAAFACVPAWLILRYGVDVPYSDQWNIAHFFEQSARGSLTLADLYAQQNEYRQLFPHLLFVVLGRLTGWDVRYEMFTSLLLACFVAWGVWRLGARTFTDPVRRGLLFLPACALNFSAIQYDNWLFGVQVVYFVPVACVVAGLLFAYSERTGTTAAVVACACLSALSTFSSANGLVAWLVLPPALLAAREGARANVWRWLPPWCVGLALCAAVYVNDYQHPGSLPETSEALRRPLDAVLYFVAYLGGPLAAGRRPLVVALMVGACALTLCAAACAYLFRHQEDCSFVRRSMPWLMLGAYSLVTGALVTVGRVGFGVGHATTTRYVAFSLYLSVGLVYLLPLVFEDAARREYLTAGRLALLKRLGTVAVVLLVLAHVVIFALVIKHTASDWRRKLLREKACLLFINVAPEERCLIEGRFYSDVGVLRERAGSLDRMGYMRPPLVRDGRMRNAATDESCADGSFKLLPAEGGAYVAEGEARLPRRGGEPADAVVLASGTTAEDQTAFALAEVGVRGARGDASWSKTFSPGAPPTASPLRLTAWAFDAEEGKAYRLCENHAAELPRR
ncbi:MAG TPA: hypothetical protein VF297_25830 [Pyrinomonadaceae bacterium]